VKQITFDFLSPKGDKYNFTVSERGDVLSIKDKDKTINDNAAILSLIETLTSDNCYYTDLTGNTHTFGILHNFSESKGSQ
jgi:hypothetical protein